MAKETSTVLLVDDEREILASVGDYLEQSFPGLRVLKATSGEEALAILNTEDVDLVLADYRMPGKNGLDLLVETARQRPDVPSIMFTAYPDLDVAIRALNEAKVRRFLVKPLQPEVLRAVVQQLLADLKVAGPPQSE